jgi:hypothetical protein
MRKALLIGIDVYSNFSKLAGCAADAKRMCQMLETHEDGTRNYDCQLFTGSRKRPIDRDFLRQKWELLFEDFKDEILFYYSGHGAKTNTGAQIATRDGTGTNPGLAMDDLLTLAYQSRAREVVLILDCCYAGGMGDPAILGGNAFLREGVTILAASSSMGIAKEVAGHGVFTDLVLSALNGAVADVRGNVSAAAIYGFVEQALGGWDQRPIYKSYASQASPIRRCKPHVSNEILRDLLTLFKKTDSVHRMNPSYEYTHTSAKKEKVEIYNKFKILRDARLLRTSDGDDLYFNAINSGSVMLTPLGQFYWNLSKKKRI